MDTYALRPEPKVKRKSPVWNILTALVLLGTCGAVYYFYSIFTHPNSILNPFPPALLPTSFRTATPTPTDTAPFPSATHAAGQQPVATRTKAPTWTPQPSDTAKPTKLSETGTITLTPMPASAEITYQPSTSVHPDAGCKWIGIGGKVIGPDGKPLAFATIRVSGTLNFKPINSIVLSGTTTLEAYGPSGFEVTLGNTPVDSSQELYIRLFDSSGVPLTDKIYFDTYNDCKKNLIMVVFTKNR